MLAGEALEAAGLDLLPMMELGLACWASLQPGCQEPWTVLLMAQQAGLAPQCQRQRQQGAELLPRAELGGKRTRVLTAWLLQHGLACLGRWPQLRPPLAPAQQDLGLLPVGPQLGCWALASAGWHAVCSAEGPGRSQM